VRKYVTMTEFATLRTDYRDHIPYYTVFDRDHSLIIATTNRRIADQYLTWAAQGLGARQIWYLSQYILKAPLRR